MRHPPAASEASPPLLSSLRRTLGPAVLPAAAGVLALLLITPAVFGLPGRFDEGFVASGAMMILQGWLPIRDFFVIYGPGQYYTVAAAYLLFGQDLAVSRGLHLATVAALAATVAATAQRLAPARGGAAVMAFVTIVATGALTLGSVYANPSASYAAVPASLLLAWSALALAHWHDARSTGSLLLASALTGLALLYRWDFGIFGLAAQSSALALVSLKHGLGVARTVRTLGLLVVPASLLAGVGFVPFIVLGDWRTWWAEVPVFHLREFAQWRSIEAVGPAVGSLVRGLRDAQPFAVIDALYRLCYLGTPFVLIGVTLWLVGRRLLSRSAALDRRDVLALTLALTAVLLLNQLRVRPTLGQAFPAFALALPLLGYVVHRSRASRGVTGRVAGQAMAAAAAAVLVVLPLYLVKDRLQEAYAGHMTRVEIPRADGIAIAQRRASDQGWWHAYRAMLAHVRDHTAPGEPIFSGVRDTSRLFINDAMLYFLVDRPPATRWIEMEPGLTNTAAGQREVVDALERGRVGLLVLWDKTSDEPNRTSRSNQVGVLDAYVQRHYEVSREFGEYTVLRRRVQP